MKHDEASAVEFSLHVPQVWLRPFKQIQSAAQDRMLRSERAMEIGCSVPTPPALLSFEGPMAHVRQLAALGRAAFAALADDKGLMHRWRGPKGEWFESEGTTIVITGYEFQADTIVFATWDKDEPFSAALGRLSEMRRLLKLPHAVASAILDRGFSSVLAPPQLLLSNVIALGEDDPETCLGESSGGAAIPTVIAVGRKTIRIKCDHRAINPGPMVAWADRFVNQLSKGGINEREAVQLNDYRS